MENYGGPKKNPHKRYTVAALCLHTFVLLASAAVSYYESLSHPSSLSAGFAHFYAVILGAFGVIGVWLTGEHCTETLRSSRLQIWGGLHVALSLTPIIFFIRVYIISPSYLSIFGLLPFVILLIPPMLILLFARKESP
ncbi:MAG: hypothetical protein RTV41_06590 [Candidatus Thorarchaeota archaeon]